MTIEHTHLSRREFLLLALATLAASCSDDDHHHASGNSSGNAGVQPVGFLTVIGDPEAAARLGQAFLAAHPEYNSDTLVLEIEQALARYDASAASTGDTQRVADALQQLVREEYIQADVKPVAGWVLSATETRLYALAALR